VSKEIGLSGSGSSKKQDTTYFFFFFMIFPSILALVNDILQYAVISRQVFFSETRSKETVITALLE